MMSHLCTAGIGRNILRSSKKAPKEVPISTNSDEVYGFLPNHRWSTRSLSTGAKSPALSIRSTRSLQPYEVPSKWEQSFQNSSLDTSGHSSGYSSQGSPTNSPNNVNYPKTGTGSDASQSTATSCCQYPKTMEETFEVLNKSTKNVAANIPMLVLRDFTAHARWQGRPEVTVRRGMVVNTLYKISEWVCVKTAEERQGFVPKNCLNVIGIKHSISDFTQQFPEDLNDTCTSGHGSMTSLASIPIPSRRKYKSTTKYVNHVQSDRTFLTENEIKVLKNMAPRQRSPLMLLPSNELDIVTSSSSTISDGDCSVTSSLFSRCEGPELTVLFDYVARQEGDISVRKQETVTALNQEDPDWIWVQTKVGQEGFIPKSYAADLKALHLDPDVKTTYL